MARRPKPWFREARGAWFVTIGGVQNNLGPDKKLAFQQFYELMRQPQERKVDTRSLIAIIDAFLDWVEKHRSPETFEWYRYRLERFAKRHSEIRVCDLKPFHAQKWVDSYPDLTVTSRRNYLRHDMATIARHFPQVIDDCRTFFGSGLAADENASIATWAEPNFERFLTQAPCRSW